MDVIDNFQPPNNKCLFYFILFLSLVTQKIVISLISFYNFGYFYNKVTHIFKDKIFLKLGALGLDLSHAYCSSFIHHRHSHNNPNKFKLSRDWRGCYP